MPFDAEQESVQSETIFISGMKNDLFEKNMIGLFS